MYLNYGWSLGEVTNVIKTLCVQTTDGMFYISSTNDHLYVFGWKITNVKRSTLFCTTIIGFFGYDLRQYIMD